MNLGVIDIQARRLNYFFWHKIMRVGPRQQKHPSSSRRKERGEGGKKEEGRGPSSYCAPQAQASAVRKKK